jgi:hypothetical protein
LVSNQYRLCKMVLFGLIYLILMIRVVVAALSVDVIKILLRHHNVYSILSII